MNVRCKCEWCESWNQGENPQECNPHPSHSEVDKERMKRVWRETYSKLNEERQKFESYDKKQLLELVDYILTCSGEFDSEPVHTLALGIKELLKEQK